MIKIKRAKFHHWVDVPGQGQPTKQISIERFGLEYDLTADAQYLYINIAPQSAHRLPESGVASDPETMVPMANISNLVRIKEIPAAAKPKSAA